MNHDYYVDCITQGMEQYLHTLALAEHMQYHQGRWNGSLLCLVSTAPH